MFIDFASSPKQYELWKILQPDCPACSGEIAQRHVGYDAGGNAQYTPYCANCGNSNIPQMMLRGGAAGGGKVIYQAFGSLVAIFAFQM